MDPRSLIGKKLERVFQIEKRDINLDTRTVSLAFASETPIERYFGFEILDCKPGSMRFARLESGAPLLWNHNPDCQIGVVTRQEIGADRVCRADVMFSMSDEGEENFQDVVQGIKRNTSVGYVIHALQLDSIQNDTETYRITDWEPYEISLVSMPADVSVGVGRSFQEESMGKTEPSTTPSLSPLSPQRAAELERIEELQSLGRIVREPDLAEEFVLNGKSVEDFRKAALEKRQKTSKPISSLVVPHTGIEFPRYSRVRNFKGDNKELKAYRFGQWFLGCLAGTRYFQENLTTKRALEFCSQNGLTIRAQTEGKNEDGGFLVPPEFINDIIDLREMYGVFRKNAKIVPMGSDTYSRPRRTGGLTAYFMTEASQITESKKGWDQVSLVAKKIGTLTKITTELLEDAVVNLGDDLMGEIAYAFSQKEDDCGFNGDGSSTYGGITGVCAKLKGLSGTIGNIAGLQVATGTGYGTNYNSIVLSDFQKTLGKLPLYAFQRSVPKWYMSQAFWGGVVQPLLTNLGGVTMQQAQDPVKPYFLGFPVEISQVLPVTSATSQVCALFGALELAADFGERRAVTIATSEHSLFEFDEIEIRGTQRFDIVVHSVGNADSTASKRVPGPIVGLITAAS